MHIAVLLLWIMNAIDAFSTFFFIHRGVAAEVNPIMRWCIEMGWWAFFVAKLGLGTVLGSLLWTRPWKGVVKVTVLFLLILYGLICSWHGFGAYLVLKGVL